MTSTSTARRCGVNLLYGDGKNDLAPRNVYEDKLNTVYAKNLLYPYCSATAYYVLNGILPPDNFGTDCAGQAKRLRQELHDVDVFAKYIDDTVSGRHRSLVCWHDGQCYYMTPYLMHRTPININSVPLVVPAFPCAQDSCSKIFISTQDATLDVRKVWLGQPRIDRFVFDLTRANFDELTNDEYTARIIHPEQNTISIRVIDFCNNETLHYLIHTSNTDRSYTISAQGISPKSAGEYGRILKKIAELIDSSPSEIQDYIFGAYKLRQTMLREVERGYY